MSFSFGFNSNDLSDDELEGESQLSATNSAKYSSVSNNGNPLDEDRLKAADVLQPELVDLSDLLTSLNNVRISFEQFKTPKKHVTLYRRELFDVKHQLMSEVGDSDDPLQNVELDILLGETSEDLRKNVYEGDLKSWECSIDVVETISDEADLVNDFDCVLELGCGTSLPSEYIFQRYLQQSVTHGLRLILSDYNKSVLRLVTIPNLIITWAKTTLSNEQWNLLQQSGNSSDVTIQDDELLLTPTLLDAFYQDIQSRNISLVFISGTWGRFFNKIAESQIVVNTSLLLITSETIYQPENLPVVAETLIEMLLANLHKSKALIAAKDIYFGVGGSIVELEKYLNIAIKNRSIPLSLNTYKIDAGLKRSIVSLE